jgi:hypothetical protein
MVAKKRVNRAKKNKKMKVEAAVWSLKSTINKAAKGRQ